MQQLLKHKVFISTRPEGQSEELSRLFTGQGAEILEMPCIQIQPATLSDSDKKLFTTLNQYQWLIFTSPNGVHYFFRFLHQICGHHNLPPNIQIGVIGNKTEKTLTSFGYKAAFKNPGATGEEFAIAFAEYIKNSQPSILLPLGNLAGSTIQDTLKTTATCTRINVYETSKPDTIDENIINLIKNDRYEMLIFTSPSGIINFLNISKHTNPEKLRIVCIGKITARAAIDNNIQPIVIAKMSNSEGIYNSIVEYYKIRNH